MYTLNIIQLSKVLHLNSIIKSFPHGYSVYSNFAKSDIKVKQGKRNNTGTSAQKNRNTLKIPLI